MTPRVALVTGGGRRVGRAIAIAMGAQGYQVAVHYNASAAGATEVVASIQGAQGIAQLFGADLSEVASPARLMDAVVAHFGRLDVLVNSAAIMERAPIGEVTARQWDEMFAINLRAPFFLAQAAAPHLAETNGCIVNIADHLTYDHEPDYVPHGISKAGIENMTVALATVLAPAVRVNAVSPGVVLMPEASSNKAAERFAASTPLQRLGTPEDVASAVCWLADATYVTGEIIRVDGGRHLRR